jgi:hypothetical protein
LLALLGAHPILHVSRIRVKGEIKLGDFFLLSSSESLLLPYLKTNTEITKLYFCLLIFIRTKLCEACLVKLKETIHGTCG